jgi:bacteriocin-like protein
MKKDKLAKRDSKKEISKKDLKKVSGGFAPEAPLKPALGSLTPSSGNVRNLKNVVK